MDQKQINNNGNISFLNNYSFSKKIANKTNNNFHSNNNTYSLNNISTNSNANINNNITNKKTLFSSGGSFSSVYSTRKSKF